MKREIDYVGPDFPRKGMLDTASALFGAAMIGGMFALLFMGGIVPNDRTLATVSLAIFVSAVCWALAFGMDAGA